VIKDDTRDYTTRPILPAVTRSMAAIDAANEETLKLYALFARVPRTTQRQRDQAELARAQQNIEAMLLAQPTLGELVGGKREEERCPQYV